MRKVSSIINILFLQIALFFYTANNTNAQEANSPAIISYIEAYASLAIKEMVRTGVPASIKIAQGILETDAGRSDLVQRSNNHFGIKCKSSWTGEKVYHNDDEEGECFRKYSSANDSYHDHSDYLKSQPRYSFLFNYEVNDYNSWAWGLKKAGYATNPIYAQTIIKYIEKYNLNVLNQFSSDIDEPSFANYMSSIKNGTIFEIEPKVEEVKSRHSKKKNKDSRNSKNKYRTHIVKKGESLYSIAKKNKISVDSIKDLNSLSSNELQIGKKLKIIK